MTPTHLLVSLLLAHLAFGLEVYNTNTIGNGLPVSNFFGYHRDLITTCQDDYVVCPSGCLGPEHQEEAFWTFGKTRCRDARWDHSKMENVGQIRIGRRSTGRVKMDHYGRAYCEQVDDKHCDASFHYVAALAYYCEKRNNGTELFWVTHTAKELHEVLVEREKLELARKESIELSYEEVRKRG